MAMATELLAERKSAEAGKPAGEDNALLLKRFNFKLPARRIAQWPRADRGQSKLLVLSRDTGRIRHHAFDQLRRYFSPGDVLVVNDTRVMPARLYGNKPSGGRVELLLLSESEPGHWKALVRNVPWDKEGVVRFADPSWEATVSPGGHEGIRDLRFNRPDVQELMQGHGKVPLPPYIRRRPADKEGLDSTPAMDWSFQDRTRYQTVYADRPGSAAAPTAGLHFTGDLLDDLRAMGVHVIPITLHVGYGTFRLIDTDDVRTHRIHSEFFRIGRIAARLLNQRKAAGGRVFAVGTTVVRALEFAANEAGEVQPGSGWNDLYVCGDHRFKVVDRMLTNFHLPKSSLLVLAASFAGRDKIFRAYRHALRRNYRFYSYGDAMLIL